MNYAFSKNPAICTPLTGKRLADILQECRGIVPKKPDLLEWRADYFEDIRDPGQLIRALAALHEVSGDIPILFTIRSVAEGGGLDSELTSAEKITLYTAVCQSKMADYIDFELSNSAEDIRNIRAISRECHVKLILSYHNFHYTPDEQFIKEKFVLAEAYEGDVGKVAVMPNSLEDVLDFMKSTLSIHRQIQIPMVAIAMGQLGAMTRLFGWAVGSQLIFAIGENTSAPGQIPIDDVRAVINTVQKFQLT